MKPFYTLKRRKDWAHIFEKVKGGKYEHETKYLFVRVVYRIVVRFTGLWK